MSEYEKVQEAVAFLRARAALVPRVGVVLGSGLGAFANALEEATAFPYRDIPHFPVATSAGHAGRLHLGRCQGVPVAVMQGRAHVYEGYSAKEVALPIRVLGALGARVLVITNAAGGINRKLRVPGLMLLRDHLNLQGANPLLGPNEEKLGPRFPDLTEPYSKDLIALAKKEARQLRLRLSEGVYAAVAGPSYETPAEIRALARLGADAVGMSTVPEVIAANHLGLRVLGISCVTNRAAGLAGKKLRHDEVLRAAEGMDKQLTALLRALLPALEQAAE